MKKLLFLLCLVAFVLTACSALPEQTDAADEAILRVVTLSREGNELKMTAMTAGIKTGDSNVPPEKVEGKGEDYAAARASAEEQRQISLAHATDWVVEEKALGDALEAFVVDPELTYDAHIYILKEQTAKEFLEAFKDEESGPSRAMDDLDRALGEDSITMLKLSRALAAGETSKVPLLSAEDGAVKLEDSVEIKEWK